MTYVIGIDAGGTKTDCLLADVTGAVIASTRAGGANLQAVGELQVEKVLHQVMEEAAGARGIQPEAICLGIAGVDRPEDAQIVRNIMKRIGARTRTVVVNDALIALAAGSEQRVGTVIVAGTGSIAYGVNLRGEAARAGGWGHLLGDEGGGSWIGRRALQSVVRHADGRGQATALTALVLKTLELRVVEDLVHEVYYHEFKPQDLARLAHLVHEAELQGDRVAHEILDAAAHELVTAACAVMNQLGMSNDSFPCFLAGGMFRAVPWLISEITVRLSRLAPSAHVQTLDIQPAIGAVRLALEEARGSARIPAYRQRAGSSV